MKICLNIPLKETALFLLFIWCFPAIVNAKQTVQEVSSQEFLEMAENAYYDEDFSTAAKYVNQYLGQPNLISASKEKAHTLATRIYLAIEDTLLAEKSVNKLLDNNPSYTPTLEMETPKYVNFVFKVKEKYVSKTVSLAQANPKQKEQNINWYIIGGTGAALTAITFLLLAADDGNTKSKPLSLPPQFPEQ